MLKKNGFTLLLLVCAAFAAGSQEDTNSLWNRLDGLLNTAEERLSPPAAGAGVESPSFLIFNNTGYVVRSVFVRKTSDAAWGDNILPAPLYNGRSVVVSMDQSFDVTALYNIRMVDIDGDMYTKYGEKIGEHTTITIGIGDFEWDK